MIPARFPAARGVGHVVSRRAVRGRVRGDTRFRAGGAVVHLSFAPDGKQLYAWVEGRDGLPRLTAWEVSTGRSVKPPSASAVPPPPEPGRRDDRTPAVILNRNRVLTAGPGNAGWVWDVGPWRQVAKLTGHAAPVTAVAASADRTLAATGSADGLIRVWDAKTFRPLIEPRGHAAAVRDIAVSRDGKRAVTTGADGAARVWDLATGRELRAFPALGRAGFSPDGLAVVVPAGGRSVPRDVVTGLEIVPAAGAEPVPDGPDPFGRVLDAFGLCFAVSPDRRTAAVAHGNGTVGLHELATGQLRRRLPGHGRPVRAMAFTPDGSRLLTGSDDHTALVWAVRVQDVPMPEDLKRETRAARLWDRMAHGPAGVAYLAMARLAADPGAAVRMARLRLKPGAEGSAVAEVRAVELLESLRTEEARALLEELADGDPGTVRAREARAALERLSRPEYNPGEARTTRGSKP
jgi:WD40 repeat protein